MPSGGSSSSRTSTVSSSPTRPPTPACRRSTSMRPAPKDSTGSSSSDSSKLPRRSRRTGVLARHQRAPRFGGRLRPDRGVRRDPPRSPRPAPGGQRQQARHHATHRPVLRVLRVLEACRGQRTDGPLILRPTSGKAGRAARRLPDGAPDRQDRGHPTTHQPALPAPRRHHQRPRRRSTPVRRTDPRPPRRPPHHPALRPSPRQPPPPRRPLPHAYVAGV